MNLADKKNISNETSVLQTGKATWNASLYDNKHSFVSKYGEDLVNVLNPLPGEKILDVGCGTGYLANVISQKGVQVTGIDSSLEMIAKAKHEYPGIDFRLMSATDFHLAILFDAVFSNAALHWVLDKQSAIECMYDCLKPGGRFVMEMGGKGNVKHITDAVKQVLLRNGFQKEAGLNLWYFPSLSEYSSLLEAKGFRVTSAYHYDRDTKLDDNANGIKDWLRMFGAGFFNTVDPGIVNDILNEVQDILRPVLFRNGSWYADYKRLRIIAIKQKQ